MKIIRRLFPDGVGLRGSAHLFQEFQCLLGDRRHKTRRECVSRIIPLDLDQREPQRRRSADRGVQKSSYVSLIVTAALERGRLVGNEAESLREMLNSLLSREDCEEWLGYNDLLHPDERPPVRSLAGLVRDPDLEKDANVDKLRLARASAFIDCFRPGLLDWQKPDESDMEWVWRFIEVFTGLETEPNQQRAIIRKLSDKTIPFKSILRAKRASRVQPSNDDLFYIWETRDMAHEDRADAWDKRTPEPFQPFGGQNLEMYYGGRKLQARWRTAVNRLLEKARKAYGPQRLESEQELD